MNRLLVAFVIGILLLGIPVQSLAVNGNNTNVSGDIEGDTSAPENNKTIAKKKLMLSKPKRNETIEVKQFKAKYSGKFSLIDWDEKKKRIKHVYGYYDTERGELRTEADAEALAREFLSENAGLFKIDMAELKFKKVDDWMVDYEQYYGGIPVYRGEVRVVMNGKGVVKTINNNFYPDINISTTPKITREEAVDIVTSKTEENLTVNETQRRINKTILYVFPESNNNSINYHLTWRVPTHTALYFIDARDGSIVQVLPTAAPISVYGSSKGWVYPDRGSASGSTLTQVPFRNEFIEVWYATPPESPAGSDYTNSSGYYSVPVTSNNDYDVWAFLDGEHVWVTYSSGTKVVNIYPLGYVTGDVQQDVDWGENYNSSVYYHVDYAWKWLYDNFGHDQPQVHAYIPSSKATGIANGGYDEDIGEYFIWWNEDYLDYTYNSDTVLHEYGHAVEYNVWGRYPGDFSGYGGNDAVTEGWPSYFAASINDDAQFAQDWNLNNNYQIDSDPPYAFAAALWDIRKAIGAAKADKLIWNATKRNKPDNTSEFFKSLLELDDDPDMGFGGNGNIDDSTPHAYEIWKAFYDHGMDYDAVITLKYNSPVEAKLNATTDPNDVFRLDTPGSKFAAVGIKPPAGNDFDIRLYSDPGPSNEIEHSNRFNEWVDFIVLDDSEASGDYYAEVSRYNGEGVYYIEMEDNPSGLSLGTNPDGFFQLNDVLDLYHIYLTAGIEYTFRTEPGVGGDIGIYLYGSTGGDGDELINSTSGGAGVTESFTYTPSSSGEYAFVVTNEDRDSSYYYSIIVTSSCDDTSGPKTPSISSPSDGSTITLETYTIDWGDVTDNGCAGMKGYEVKEAKSGGSTKIYPTSLTSELDFSKSPSDNGNYTYWVRGVDNFDNKGSWSSPVSITLNIPEPPPPQEPTLPFGIISDFSDGGTDYEDIPEGAWGVWTYSDWESGSNEWHDYITKFPSVTDGTHIQDDVASFYWNNVDVATDMVWIEKTGQWDFEFPVDGEFTLMVKNTGGKDEGVRLNLTDSTGKNAVGYFDDAPRGVGWTKIELYKSEFYQVDTGFDWSNVTTVRLTIEAANTGYIRNLYIDDLKYNMDVYLYEQYGNYIVNPGDEYMLRLKAINDQDNVNWMDIEINKTCDNEKLGGNCRWYSPAKWEIISNSLTDSKTKPGYYDYPGSVYFNIIGSSDVEKESNTVTIIVLDNVPPTVSITAPNEGDLINSSSVTVNWTGSDNGAIAYYEIRSDSGSWINKSLSTNHTFTPGDGPHTVWVRATDEFGNPDTTYVSFTIDTTAPSTPLIWATPSLWTSTDSFNVTWMENSTGDPSGIAGAYYKLDSPPTSNTDYDGYSTANPIQNVQVLTDGIHPIYVWLKDGAGNADYNNAGTTDLNYDGTAPDAPADILWQDGQYSTDTTITADWGDVSDTSGIQDYYLQVDIDSQDFTSGLIFNGSVGSSIKTLTSADGIADGHTYYYRVKARNGAGLLSSTWSVKSAGVIVDTNPPVVENSTTSDIMSGEDETVTVDAYDPNGIDTVILRLDSTTDYEMSFVSGNTYTVTIPSGDLTGGQHSIRYYVNDTAGNMNSSVTDTFEVIVDDTPPTITITSPENTSYSTDSVDLNYTVNDSSGVDWVGYSLDGGANTSTSDKITDFSDSSGTRLGPAVNLSFNRAGSNTSVYLRIPKNTTIPQADMNITGFENSGLKLDQEVNETGDSGGGLVLRDPPTYKNAQQFKPSQDGYLTLWSFKVYNYRGADYNYTLEIWEDLNDLPDKNTIIYSKTYQSTYLDSNWIWRNYTVEPTVWLNASRKYWIVIWGYGENSIGQVIFDGFWDGNVTDKYPYHYTESDDNGSTWLYNGNYERFDLMFKIYLGYTAYPSNITVDVSNDTVPDWSMTGELNLSNSPQQITNLTSALNDCVTNNVADTDGYVYCQLNFTSDTAGIVELSGLSVEYSTTTITNLSNGQHSITIYANDTLGNMGSSTVGFTVQTDTSPPTINITSPPNATITDATPLLNVTTSEPSTITYSWNSEGSITGCQNCTTYLTTYGEYANSSEQNLSLALHLNENTGTAVHDDSTNGNDGTLTSPIWARGRFASGLDFEKDEYLTVPYSGSLTFNDSFTISFWTTFKEDDRNQWIISNLNKTAGGGWAGFHINRRDSDNKLRFMVHSPTGASSGLAYPVSNNTLYHVVLVRDRANQELRLYLNSTLEKSKNDSTANLSVNISNPLVIGANSYNFGDRLNGTLDEVLIFNRVLGETEIAGLFNRTLSNGQHNVTVYAKDNDNNLGSAARWFSIAGQ